MWAAIHAVGAAAERRVWTTLGINKLHPNLFVFLVGPPGIGKSQAINPMSVVLRKSAAVTIAPTDMTKQGLLDALAQCSRASIVDGRPFDYHFMAICISELSNFMSQYDHALAGLLTDLFDCPPINEEQKRGRGDESIVIPFPGISFIMGTATENLGNTITKDMWGSGFMARVIMIYSAEEIIPDDMFAAPEVNEVLAEQISVGLRRVGQMKGDMTWTPEAQKALREFRIKQKHGAPIHNRLAHYVTRRWLHLAKLCMIAALSQESQEVELADFLRAKRWLLDAEEEMPEIFKDMVSHEDGQVYEELRTFLFTEYMTKGKVPISVPALHQFLAKRVSTHSVARVIEIALASDYMRRIAGTSGDDALYVPGMQTGPAPGII